MLSKEIRNNKDIIIATTVENERIEDIITIVKKANCTNSLLKEKKLTIRESKEGYELKNGYLF